jgi:MFS family permease
LLAAAQAPLGSTMIAVALPSITLDLHADPALVASLLVTTYLIVNIVSQSPGGKLGDVLGHARSIRLGMGLQALSGLVGIFASRLGWLAFSRCALALGGALVIPATMALLRLHVPAERRGRVFGLVGATMSLSAAIGPPLGGKLVTSFGWHAIFYVSLPCLALAAVITRLAPPPAPGPGRRTSLREFARGFDWTGSALLTASLVALVIVPKLHGAALWAAIAACAGFAFAFVRWELRCASPVLDPRLFQRRAFSAGSAIIGLSNFAMYGLLFSLPQFFQQVRGAKAEQVGAVLSAMTLATFVTSPLGGRLADRIGARGVALAGLCTMLAGVLWLGHAAALRTAFDAVGGLVLLGVGIGLSTAPAQAAAMAAIDSARSGMAAGATSTLRYLGGALSILMLSAILGGEHNTITAAAHETASIAFAVATAIATVTCLALPGR